MSAELSPVQAAALVAAVSFGAGFVISRYLAKREFEEKERQRKKEEEEEEDSSDEGNVKHLEL